MELLVQTLLFACGSLFDPGSSFAQRRAAVSMVCRGWYHVVEDIGAFWSDYSITEDLDPDDLEQWAARAGRTPLHLHAVFEIVRLLPPPGGRLAVNTILIVVSPFLTLCQSLSVCAEDLISLPVVLDAMRATSFPLLLKLAIARIHVESTADVDPTLPMTNVFNAVFPQLTFLRLVNAIFCWADMCKFTHLTTLILHNITGNLAPTMGNIAMVLRSVPFLARLSARKLDCVRSTVEHGIVELTKLVSMDVQLDGCEAFADLLAGCSFPALRTLSVMLSNPIDSGLILKTELFETVHHFIGAGIAPGTKEAVKMYERMSDLRSLDVSSGSRRFLTPFMSKRGPSKSVLCPLLNDVTLCEIDMNDLKTYVDILQYCASAYRFFFRLIKSRGPSAVRFSSVDVHFWSTWPHNLEHIAWINAHVTSFRIDPPFKFPLDWVDA